jgi:hypothetical protein
MFFPPLRVDVVVSLVPLGETICDKRPEYAVLLVDAVEEGTNMTMWPGSVPDELGRLRGDLHVLTLRRLKLFRTRRNGLAPPGSIPRSAGHDQPLRQPP